MKRSAWIGLALLLAGATLTSLPATAEDLPWLKAANSGTADDGGLYEPDPYAPVPASPGSEDADDGYTYEPPSDNGTPSYEPPSDDYSAPADVYHPPKKSASPSYDDAYETPPEDGYGQSYGSAPPYEAQDDTFSVDEIKGAGHRFFGRVTENLASVIEYAFQQSGRPNGYILGEEGGGAFIAGLRYGEGTLVTRNAGHHKVFWQGPSVGYDFGAEGSKTMILVYNLHSPRDIYSTFGGVSGSAYVVGGVGITYLTDEQVTLAPIRSGIGLRLGANVGYLKYTQAPTWNPF
jgi:hypothetical protein